MLRSGRIHARTLGDKMAIKTESEKGKKKFKISNISSLRPEQEPLYQQAVQAGLEPGAGGAFGEAADYYRNLLGNEPEDFGMFAAPELRRYNEEIVPGLSEQFAGMGAGGLSSSGFRNAQIQGATDLSERLGQLRAQLRQSAAQGLMSVGQFGLQNFSENVRNKPQATGGENIAQGVGESLPYLAAGAYDYYKNRTNNQKATGSSQVGNPAPYQGGNNIDASPKV